MEELYDWLFHYNPYTKVWAAFKRDDVSDYFNGNLDKTLRSKSQDTLVELITKYGGDTKKIEKYTEKVSK